MKLNRLLLGFGLACALTAAAPPAKTAGGAAALQSGGQTYTHEAGGITFDVPAGWKTEANGAQLTVSPAEGGISVAFWVTEEDEFDAATEAVGEELGKMLKNVKLDGEPKEDTHNGMPHASFSGTGEFEGHEVLFSADLLQAKKPVIVLTVGAPAQLEKHAAAFAKMVKSIRKLG